MVSIIILAAGESKRFGSPKQLAKINNNQTLIEYVISNVKKSSVAETIVVLGAYKDLIAPLMPSDTKIAFNEQFKKGQTSSIKKGLEQISPQSEYFLILPVDISTVSPKTIDRIIYQFKNAKASIGIPTFEGKKGHPPIYDIGLKQEIVNLDDDEPLYLINRKFQEKTVLINVNDPRILININSPQDLEKIKNGL